MLRKVLVSLALAALLAVPAAADWLVTREGAKIETRGPWTVRGSLVVFTLANGTLSSMRASEFDLAASTRATEDAARPAEALQDAAAEPPAPDPVLILTNKDVRTAGEALAGIERPEKGKETSEDGKIVSDDESGVLVSKWSEEPSMAGGGIAITGWIENRTNEVVAKLQLKVDMINDKADSLGSIQAYVEKTTLGPGDATTFRAVFLRLEKGQGLPRFELTSMEPPPKR